tara:strand:+ start:159 stop:692 length:534 start_codon:yes stop_codon:yes gene_type:complete
MGYKMKGSPHKLGTIVGTSAFKQAHWGDLSSMPYGSEQRIAEYDLRKWAYDKTTHPDNGNGNVVSSKPMDDPDGDGIPTGIDSTPGTHTDDVVTSSIGPKNWKSSTDGGDGDLKSTIDETYEDEGDDKLSLKETLIKQASSAIMNSLLSQKEYKPINYAENFSKMQIGTIPTKITKA